jgi:hypothetical protein
MTCFLEFLFFAFAAPVEAEKEEPVAETQAPRLRHRHCYYLITSNGKACWNTQRGLMVIGFSFL